MSTDSVTNVANSTKKRLTAFCEINLIEKFNNVRFHITPFNEQKTPSESQLSRALIKYMLENFTSDEIAGIYKKQ